VSPPALVALAFALAVAALGLWGVVAPRALLGFVARTSSTAGLAWAVALRVAFGASLLAAASTSRSPQALRVLGALTLASAAALPFFGAAGRARLVAWWSQRSSTFVRTWAAAAAAFGLFVAWAVGP
jgi:hypothetical protein